jgi:hypothetical protein
MLATVRTVAMDRGEGYACRTPIGREGQYVVLCSTVRHACIGVICRVNKVDCACVHGVVYLCVAWPFV